MRNINTCFATAENVKALRVSSRSNGEGFTFTIIARDSLPVSALWNSLVSFESLNGTKFSLLFIWLSLGKKLLFISPSDSKKRGIKRKKKKKKKSNKHAHRYLINCGRNNYCQIRIWHNKCLKVQTSRSLQKT